jgi:membrane-bound lytic murein transglycosylase D
MIDLPIDLVIDSLIRMAPLLLKWNLLLGAAASVTWVVSKLSLKKSFIRNSAKQLIGRVLLLAVLLAPLASMIAARLIEPANLFEPPVQIAATATPHDFKPTQKSTTFVVSRSLNSDKISEQTKSVLAIAIALIGLTLISAASRLNRILKDKRKLRQISDHSFTIRCLRHVKIQMSEKISVPFAARLDGQALVLLPQNLLKDPNAMNIATRHELQHHRQKDLQWNNLLEAARFIAGWNPLVRNWLERIEEIDELACDENLLGRGRIDVKRYAVCLYEAALAAQKTGDTARLAGTARMATSPQFLKRRIQMTLSPPKTSHRWLTALALSFAVLATTATAWTSEGLIKDRRISQSQAESLARRAQLKGGIPINVNKRVLNYLNFATGNPRARFYMRNALKRMKVLRPMIEVKLAQANMPSDLLALAAMESGFQNTESMTSAGIWQFVPATARKYGLQVDDSKDERLDADRETDAAIAYLSHLQSLFQNDWMLSLLSYNMGEGSVRDIVSATGERNVFKLADEGKLIKDENANYVPKFLAALIIINNPSLVNE